MDFYNYAYLKSNNYLNRFRSAWELPLMDYSLLNAILKTIYKMSTWRMEKDEKGNTIWRKDTLNMLLTAKAAKALANSIVDEWDERDYYSKKAGETKPSADDDEINPETDMDYVSKKMVDDDNFVLRESDIRRMVTKCVRKIISNK